MNAIWVGLIGTWGLQVITTAFLAGKMTERFSAIQRWKEEEAEPKLDDHESRLVTLESVVPFGPPRERRR